MAADRVRQRETMPPGTRLVLVSEELFLDLGADRVDWGEPDAYGRYTPTLYRETVPS